MFDPASVFSQTTYLKASKMAKFSRVHSICIAIVLLFSTKCLAIGHDLILGNCSDTFNMMPIYTQVIDRKNNGFFSFFSTVEYLLKFPNVSVQNGPSAVILYV